VCVTEEQAEDAVVEGAAIRVFLSYRKEDTSGHALHLYEDLVERFGRENVFMDMRALEPGLDYEEAIDAALEICDVLLCLIGTRWMSAANEEGLRRLDDPDDWVSRELEAALARPGVRVIPVLVERAQMPRRLDLPKTLASLARRQAFDLSNMHFAEDVARLVAVLERVAQQKAESAAVKREAREQEEQVQREKAEALRAVEEEQRRGAEEQRRLQGAETRRAAEERQRLLEAEERRRREEEEARRLAAKQRAAEKVGRRSEGSRLARAVRPWFGRREATAPTAPTKPDGVGAALGDPALQRPASDATDELEGELSTGAKVLLGLSLVIGLLLLIVLSFFIGLLWVVLTVIVWVVLRRRVQPASRSHPDPST
jgi:chemotaxis protein histidine kinase CheA